jgi:hypothetical protein
LRRLMNSVAQTPRSLEDPERSAAIQKESLCQRPPS